MAQCEVGIGVLGYSFMGRAHSNAYHQVPYVMWPATAVPKLVSICGRDELRLREAAIRFGYSSWVTDWHDLVADPRVMVFDNCGPNHVHLEPTLAAIRAGKHVLCEKPLGRTAHEAKLLRDAAAAAGVQHMTGFNYRFVPAIQLMRDRILAGTIGDIYGFRATYLQSWLAAPRPPRTWWRLHKETAGSGALGDLGSHVIDLGRYLCGEPTAVSAVRRSFVTGRPVEGGGAREIDVDDSIAGLVEFDNGAMGILEASRVFLGRYNYLRLEINGSAGAMCWDLENLNNLRIYSQENDDTSGFRTISVTQPSHPFVKFWWPAGHILGWEHSFVHEIHHFLEAVAGAGAVGPRGATFEDGYRAAVVVDAILESADCGRRIEVSYT